MTGAATYARRVGRRGAAALVVFAVFAVAVPGAALADQEGAIYLKIDAANHPPDQTFLRHDFINDPDVVDQWITLNPSGGSKTGNYSGVSTLKLLSMAHVDPMTVQAMTITEVRSGHTVSLTPEEVTDGFRTNPNAADTQPSRALFSIYNAPGTSFSFIRPMRSAGDDNQSDAQVATVTGGAGDRIGFDVTLRVNGGVLSVSEPTVSPDGPKAHSLVQFGVKTVTLNGGPPVGSLHYAWTFGDGGTGSGRAPNHTYAEDCRCAAEVTVTDDGDNAGTAQVTVAVGSAPDPGPPDPKVGTGGTQNDTGAGVAPKDATATGLTKKKTVASLTKRKTAKTKKTASASSAGSGGRGGSSGSGRSTGAAGGAGAAGGRATANPGPGGSGVDQATKRRRQPPTGSSLSGVLIDSSATALTEEQLSALATPQQAASARSSRGSGHKNIWLGYVLPMCVVALIVALGGLTEFRPRARYRRLLTS